MPLPFHAHGFSARDEFSIPKQGSVSRFSTGRTLFICLFLCAVTLLIYRPVGDYDFLCYDDNQFVTQNPTIQSGLNWQSFRYALTASIAENWHPVTTLSHILDCEFLGINPGRMHLVNVLFHIANGLLLFLLLKRMTGSLWRSAVAAALFAWHPLRVESVAWIAERKDVLSCFFMLLTLWAYTRYVECIRTGKSLLQTGPATDSPHAQRRLVPDLRLESRFYWLAFACFLLGLMSKPMLVTLPFVMILLDSWPLERITSCDGKTLIALVREKLPFLWASGVFCWLTLNTQKGEVAHFPFQERLATAITSYVRYLGKTFWPTDLAVLYPHPARHYAHLTQWPTWEISVAALLLLGLTYYLFTQFRRRPELLTGWLWFLGTLVPVIGLVQVGEQAMADRYTYIPSIGLSILVVWGVSALWSAGQRPLRIVIVGLTLIVLGLLPVLSAHQLRYWHDSGSLFEHCIRVTRINPIAESNWGYWLATQGETNAAEAHYRAATAIAPDYPQAHFNLAGILKDQQKWGEAAQEYLTATKLTPSLFMPHLALAEILPHLNRCPEAAAHMEKVLELESSDLLENPNNPFTPATISALNNLAWSLATSEDPKVRDGKKAVVFSERACELSHYQEPVLVGTLAAAYAEAGRFEEAIPTAQKASELAYASGNAALAERNQQLAALYRARRPYRESAGTP